MQRAEHERAKYGADAWNAAQRIGRMELAVECLDRLAEAGQLGLEVPQTIDLEGDFQLQQLEIHSAGVQALRLSRSGLEAIHQSLGERAAMWVVAAGMLSDKAEQRRPSCAGDLGGIKEVMQDCECQVRPEVR